MVKYAIIIVINIIMWDIMYISRSIIFNIGEDIIKKFLNDKDIPKEKLLNG